jgi:hypothetical protein
MNIEIHRPDLALRVREGMKSSRFHDVDELLAKALDALSEKESSASAAPPSSTRTTFEQGLGLFGGPEDAALLDEVVAIAYEERHRPTEPPPAL